MAITILILLISSNLLNKTATAVEQNKSRPEQAIFAGGCFWCMEKPFDTLEGVMETIPGYTGGKVDNPTYAQVSSGVTGHFEAIKIIYNPAKVSYEKLLTVFWRNIDPTNNKGQFCDVGNQYKSAIFYENAAQKNAAELSKAQLEKDKPFVSPIVTIIQPASAFFPAEAYHHDYYRHNPIRYKFYRYTCGRDQRLEELWGEK